MRCAVFGCNTDNQVREFKNNKFSFYNFPRDKIIRCFSACSRSDKFNVANETVLKKLFDILNKHNKLSTTKPYIKTLINLAKDINCSDKMKILFFRSRMFFRIKYLNYSLKDSNNSRNRKLTKLTT